MPNELKPCPFCGGIAELTFSGKSYMSDYMKGFIIVKCTMCGAAAKGYFYEGGEILIPLEETIGGIKAVDAWNRRADNA